MVAARAVLLACVLARVSARRIGGGTRGVLDAAAPALGGPVQLTCEAAALPLPLAAGAATTLTASGLSFFGRASILQVHTCGPTAARAQDERGETLRRANLEGLALYEFAAGTSPADGAVPSAAYEIASARHSPASDTIKLELRKMKAVSGGGHVFTVDREGGLSTSESTPVLQLASVPPGRDASILASFISDKKEELAGRSGRSVATISKTECDEWDARMGLHQLLELLPPSDQVCLSLVFSD